jgi:hypothetical protein
VRPEHLPLENQAFLHACADMAVGARSIWRASPFGPPFLLFFPFRKRVGTARTAIGTKSQSCSGAYLWQFARRQSASTRHAAVEVEWSPLGGLDLLDHIIHRTGAGRVAVLQRKGCAGRDTRTQRGRPSSCLQEPPGKTRGRSGSAPRSPRKIGIGARQLQRQSHISGTTIARSSRTCSGPRVVGPFQRGQNEGARDRLIAPTIRKASPRPKPVTPAVIHKAQGGKLSIDVPRRTGGVQIDRGMVNE